MQIRDLGSGNFGVAKLVRDRVSNELVAVKFIERGDRVRSAGLGSRLRVGHCVLDVGAQRARTARAPTRRVGAALQLSARRRHHLAAAD